MDEAMDMRFDMVAQGKALGELLPDMCRQVYDIAEMLLHGLDMQKYLRHWENMPCTLIQKNGSI